MLGFSILGDPPSVAETRARQRAAGVAGETAVTTTLLCPIPGVDVAAGLIAGAIDDNRNSDERNLARGIPGAVDRDWSGHPLAARYVDKVRAQGRDLTKEELLELQAVCQTQNFVVDRAEKLAGNALSDLAESFFSSRKT